MRKKKVDTLELELEEYNEPFDDYFYSLDTDDDEIIEVEDESNYDNFNTVQEIDWDAEEEIEEEEEEPVEVQHHKTTSEDSLFYRVFPTVSSWFGTIGVILAIIIILSFILHGSVKSLLLFLLMLVASYGLGYICMFFIMQFIEIK